MVNASQKYLIAVDDEDDLRFLFEHFFRDQIEAGHLNLLFFNDAKDCLEALKDVRGDIVVLTDICMPDISGMDLLRSIKKDFSDVNVLLVSAYDRDRYQDEMAELGAVGYISKPVDFDELKEKVLNILDITQ